MLSLVSITFLQNLSILNLPRRNGASQSYPNFEGNVTVFPVSKDPLKNRKSNVTYKMIFSVMYEMHDSS